MTTRRYTKQRRAEAEEATRARILDAVIALHEEVGPSRTTIRAIADRAGVERLTVYRHFPDEESMIRSCSAVWSQRNPPPPLPEATDGDALTACRRALAALYAWYRRNESLLAHVATDRREMASVDAAAREHDGYLDELVQRLDRLWPRRNARRVATLRHAVEFSTWQSLHRVAGGDKQAVTLVAEWLRGA